MPPLQKFNGMHAHSKPAGIGLAVLALFALVSISTPALLGSVLKPQTVANIGIEHEQPLSLLLEVGTNGDDAVFEFFSETSETILLSVPSTWVRREVRNAPIHTVTAEPPSIGFTRWTLPGRSGISFRVPNAPDSVVLHNPTAVQMKLSLNRVDIQKEEVRKDVLLIQEDTVTLW